jgi:PE-PPE domain
MITVEGAVKYPRWVDARPIYEFSEIMRALARTMNEGARGIRVAAISGPAWSGRAADDFNNHMSERSKIVTLLAEVASEAAPVIDAYAQAIESSQHTYSEAANIEVESRKYLPASYAVVEGAMAAEVAAIVALGVAGTTFAASLSGLMLKAEAADTFGITRNPYEVVRDTVNGIADAWNHNDIGTGVVRGANTTGSVEHADGSVTQSNILGLSISRSGFGRLVSTLEVLGGVIGLLNATPLTIRQTDGQLADLQAGGFKIQPANARELGVNLALTEEYQRAKGIEPDQSSVIPYSIGIGPDGRRVISMHVPGIVPPGKGSVNGASGPRNVTGAALSEITGLGTVETAIRQQLEALGVKRGDHVVLYGHSYGGIVARNNANALAREGIKVSFVSIGSPDGPLEPGVEAFMVQNTNDPVPATRIGGDGIEGARYASNQQVILVHQKAPGGVIDNHDSRFYGENLMKTPNLALNDFLRRQNQVTLNRTGMVTLEGPLTPSGAPNTGREPFRLPAPPSGK